MTSISACPKQSSSPQVSLIITFYNKLDYLKLVLASIEQQTFTSFEVIIADDGSTRDVVDELEGYCRQMPFPISHVWQDDIGYRRSRIINEAAKVARGNYLIIIDGDCLLHPRFIEEHYLNRNERYCLTGRRVNLSEAHSAMLTDAQIRARGMKGIRRRALMDALIGRATRVEDGIYLRSTRLRKWRNRRPAGLLGCNMSLHRSNLFKVNGFDERYVRYGYEESDLELRLEILGVTPVSLKNIAIQYHLYHPSRRVEADIEFNLALLEATRQRGAYYTEHGIVGREERELIEHPSDFAAHSAVAAAPR
jgi:glycosyltransferase involved in cell wall biosynthesis